jgi:enamine deaminase RidA (YjgF/YER057c/UK114 family)
MAAAKTCAINLLTQLKAACDGDLDRLVQVVKLGGFVNSTSDFVDQPKVINGASDFFVAALGLLVACISALIEHGDVGEDASGAYAGVACAEADEDFSESFLLPHAQRRLEEGGRAGTGEFLV